MFNKGEIMLQQHAGAREMADRISTAITNRIIPGAVAFIENQQMAVVSSLDEERRLWVSLLHGESGFIHIPDPGEITFNLRDGIVDSNDILLKNLQANSPMAALFIELSTRRRFKVNGQGELQGDQIHFTIREALGNCPKYIQRRIFHPTTANPSPATTTSGNSLGTAQIDQIKNADTLFVGSQGDQGRMGVNHRGGKKGFVEILEDGTLKIPDYIGNNLFSTLGNIITNEKTGLLFIDFENGRTLQLTGRGEVLLDQAADSDVEKSMGTGRFWLFKTDQWIQTEIEKKGDWEFLDASPYNP